MVYELRKRPHSFWPVKEDWVNRNDRYEISKSTCKMVWDILEFNWIDKEKVSWVDLWAGTWINLLWFRDIWMNNIFWVDSRPRAIESWIDLRLWKVEDLGFIEWSSMWMVFSCNLFDGRVYHQNRQEMLEEIHRILWKEWLYFWAEYQEEVDLRGSIKQIAWKEIPWKGFIKLQVIKKWCDVGDIIPWKFL